MGFWLTQKTGAAIALLDSVYLPLWLPSTTTFKTVVYGLPRVGNQDCKLYSHIEFLIYSIRAVSGAVITQNAPLIRGAVANYVDAHVHLTHINNKEDPVPILPGRFLGFVHPAGEIHIEDSNAWDACPGQDNPSKLCIVGDVPEIWDGDESDHDGPYNGVTMGC
jgi:hypothetical protein